MAKTINDAIEEARVLLQDTVSPYRYPSEQLLAYLNNGLYELKRVRPDAWLSKTGKDLPTYSNTTQDLAQPFPVSMIFFHPMVMLIAGMAELRDDEFTMDSRAGVLLQQFTANLTKVSGGMM